MNLALAPMTDITTWVRGSGLEIVLFVLGVILASRAVRWAGAAITDRIDAKVADGAGLVRSESAKHAHVVAQVSMWAVIVLLYCVAAVLTLQRLGVPITSLVAPAAVVGVALGFGAQRLVQDILAGVFIITERQYGFGDVVRISALGSEVGVSGTVEEVTLRITRLRTVNGEVVIVANGQIVQVTNQSRDWARAVIDVPVPSTVDVARVREILSRVGTEARDDQELGPLLLDPPSVLGVESLEVDTLHVRMVARTLPGKQFTVGRELRARVALAFQAEGINVSTSLETPEPVGAS
ncbi:mechanosensitive ion channel family protein [Micromonospora sp. NPDC050417]|uniref:mechanosensitive ion channel family protein n=1 Tax=Micromonospora sp. NPDC050417 TaxID=3364280 RepID=UPI0037A53ACA